MIQNKIKNFILDLNTPFIVTGISINTNTEDILTIKDEYKIHLLPSWRNALSRPLSPLSRHPFDDNIDVKRTWINLIDSTPELPTNNAIVKIICNHNLASKNLNVEWTYYTNFYLALKNQLRVVFDSDILLFLVRFFFLMDGELLLVLRLIVSLSCSPYYYSHCYYRDTIEYYFFIIVRGENMYSIAMY